MSEVSEPSRDELLKILEQNCLHARHAENVRLWFTNVYVVVVAAIFALAGKDIISDRFATFSLVILIVWSIGGICVTYNTSGAIKNHVDKARFIANRLGLGEYLALGLLFAKKGIWKYLMRPWEFYILYAVVIGICIYGIGA